MKVMYRVVGDPVNVLKQESISTEEFKLPWPALKEMRRDLETSNMVIPESARTLQGWKVGLLNRWGSAT